MCKWNNGGVIVKLPKEICSWKQNHTVCSDECIVNQIKALWIAGYETLGSCCGHGREGLSVVVGEGYTKEEIKSIAGILRKNDNRSWSIKQWSLQTVMVSQNESLGLSGIEKLQTGIFIASNGRLGRDFVCDNVKKKEKEGMCGNNEIVSL